MPAKKKSTTKKAQKGGSVVKAAEKKTAVKAKPVAKKSSAKKVSSKVTQSSSKSVPIKVSKSMSKTELLNAISSHVGVARKEIGLVFDSLAHCISLHVQGKSPQVFTLPGLLKIKVIRKPATKERKGINPFTGEPAVFKAKPARNVVKVLPLKRLKEMAK